VADLQQLVVVVRDLGEHRADGDEEASCGAD